MWQRGVKSSRAWISPFITVGGILAGSISRTVPLGVVGMTRQFGSICKNQGPAGLSLYLKACSIALMKWRAGDVLKDTKAFGPTLGLTKSGMPRIIPKAWRRAIASGNTALLRLCLTMFGLYRVLDFKGKVKLSTITDPWKGSLPKDLIAFVPEFWALTKVKWPGRFPWAPRVISTRGSPGGVDEHNAPLNSTASLWESLRGHEVRKTKSHLMEFAEILKLKGYLVDLFHIDEILCKWSTDKPLPAKLGKLSFKEEPGKVRVFALVDPVTQWVTKPLHDWLFYILRAMPTDATFDQGKGVEYVKGRLKEISKTRKPEVFSFDLSAATDRLPIALQKHILNHWHPRLGESWANLLTDRDYFVPRQKPVRYATGQPMGAYSSWAMLAITHHFIVQYCARKAGYSKWFGEYMVLGDDIVIMDSKVATNYQNIMKVLAVDISPSKSLRSKKGYFEFAKRFCSMDEDLQGLPLKLLLAAKFNISVLVEFVRSLKPTTPLSRILALFGMGYRKKARIYHVSHVWNRFRYLQALLTMPTVRKNLFDSWGDWVIYNSPGIQVMPFHLLILKLWKTYKWYRVKDKAYKGPSYVSIFAFNRYPLRSDKGLIAGMQPDRFTSWVEMNLDAVFNPMRPDSTVWDQQEEYFYQIRKWYPPFEGSLESLYSLIHNVPPLSLLYGEEDVTVWREYRNQDPVVSLTPHIFMEFLKEVQEYTGGFGQICLPKMPKVTGSRGV